MKNLFKKAVSLTVALSTVAVLSVSAFAATTVSQPEGETYTITANESCDAITVTNYTGSSDATQYAVAIVKKGFDGSDDSDIYYVNQSAEAATLLTNMLVKATLEGETLTTTLPDGDYEVRIGNNDPESGYVAINFTVTTSTDGGDSGEGGEGGDDTQGDFITSADTNKGTINVDVASVTHETMGLAVGNAIVSLALDTTVYPNAGAATAGYVVAVVDNTTGNYVGTVYYSAERAKYIALIPKTVTDYKFEVLASGENNAVIAKYGNMNEDADGKLTQTVDFRDFKRAYLASSNSPALSDAKKALIADVTGDGKLATKDFREFKKAYLNQSYTFDVLTLD